MSYQKWYKVISALKENQSVPLIDHNMDDVFVAIETAGKSSGVGLAFLPDVFQVVGLPVEQFKKIILSLAQDGSIELRPESGVGLLSPEQAAVVPDFKGRPLSYARVL